MKLYISADIEGVCGVTSWDEADKTHRDYAEFRRQMTLEVAAACEGARDAGVAEILVRDAHGSATNILAGELPEGVQLVRAWSGDPLCMVQELEASFDAAMFIGYHARAGSGDNPLAHTMAFSRIAQMRINDIPASEYRIHAFAAATLDVPVVLVSGDEGICEEVQDFQPACTTVAVKRGSGFSTINLHPKEAIDKIRSASKTAMAGDLSASKLELPSSFKLEIEYKDQRVAFLRSFYPGIRQETPTSLIFETDEYYEVLRALRFIL